MTKTDDDFLASRGLTDCEVALAGWETNDDCTSNTVHNHFTKLEPTFSDCWDVASEGRRLYSVMFDERIEEYSPVDSILNGIAASAYFLAIYHVAELMGVSAESVQIAMDSCDTTNAVAFANECLSVENRRSE